MARTKQTKKFKPSSPDSTKFLNKSKSKAIVKAKHKNAKRRAASVLASSHKDKKLGCFCSRTCKMLWICIGNPDYLVSNAKNFLLEMSVRDLNPKTSHLAHYKRGCQGK